MAIAKAFEGMNIESYNKFKLKLYQMMSDKSPII
jgi:hypothetical protein